MRKAAGFTLMELMITVVIVGILAAIALPSYERYVMESNRSDAIAELQSILAAQERYYLDNMTYSADLTDLGFGSSTYVTDLYSYSAATCSNPTDLTLCVQITADGIGRQANDGDIMMDTVGRATFTPDGGSPEPL